MPRAEERSIPAPPGALAAKAWGDPDHPPLLALHGWLDNAGSFDRLAPRLATDRYVVALDLRGHGRSAHAVAGSWPLYVDYFDDIRAVYDHFGWDCADLLGHSLGGTLASLFAALYPGRVGELVLVEALGPLAAAPEDALSQLRKALDQRAGAARRKPLRVFETIEDAVAARIAVNGLSEDAARALVGRGVRAVEGGYVWSSDPRLTLTSPQRYTETQVLAMLKGIQAPTLLVLATPATSYLPSAMMETRAAQVDGIRIERLPGGHHLHLEESASVAAAMDAFRHRGSARRRSAVETTSVVSPKNRG